MDKFRIQIILLISCIMNTSTSTTNINTTTKRNSINNEHYNTSSILTDNNNIIFSSSENQNTNIGNTEKLNITICNASVLQTQNLKILTVEATFDKDFNGYVHIHNISSYLIHRYLAVNARANKKNHVTI